MRTIISERKKKSKERFNKILFGGGLILIILLSIVGYSLNSSISEKEKKITYNGYEFIEKNSFWVTEINGLDFVFRTNPNDVPKITGAVNYFNAYSNLPLYIQSDDELSTAEIYNNLINNVQRMQKACFEKEGCEEDIPIKNCSNNFIIIQESNLTSITQDNQCVFITANKDDLVKVTDEFLLKILGINDYY